MKIQKKKFFLGLGGSGGGGRWGGVGGRGSVGGEGEGDQGGCERRIEVFVKIQKKNFFWWGVRGGGGGGVRVGGVRVDVKEELKFL